MTLKARPEDRSLSHTISDESETSASKDGGVASIKEEMDSTIWSSFVQGSEQALSQLFERYGDKLFNYGRQFTADEELVKDAIQDVFYQLIKTKDKLAIAQSVKHYIF